MKDLQETNMNEKKLINGNVQFLFLFFDVEHAASGIEIAYEY